MNNPNQRQEQFKEAEITDLPADQSTMQQAFPGAESLSGGPDDLPNPGPEDRPATEEISEAELSETDLGNPFELEWQPIPGSAEQEKSDRQGRRKALLISAAVVVVAFGAFVLLGSSSESEVTDSGGVGRFEPPEFGSAEQQIVKQRPGPGGAASSAANPEQQLQAAARLLEGQELPASLGKNSQKLAAELSRRLGIPVVAGNRRPKQGLAVTVSGDNVLIFPPRNAPPEVFETLVSAQWKK